MCRVRCRGERRRRRRRRRRKRASEQEKRERERDCEVYSQHTHTHTHPARALTMIQSRYSAIARERIAPRSAVHAVKYLNRGRKFGTPASFRAKQAALMRK